MEGACEAAAAGGDKCAANGGCARQDLARDHTNNIDDISTPSDLKFDNEFTELEPEDPETVAKRAEIEKCLENVYQVSLEEWRELARGRGGLVADEYRKIIWPLLVGVTEEEMTEPPSLEELSTHSEYNQVVLDVNRSLKRFPPGVPYARRLALQDQLTVLILRVIIQHPHLRYYQGYHDVAITLLLVCGARAACPLLARLSWPPPAPLAPLLQPTMQPAQHRLNHLLPLLRHARPDLADFMHKAQVGTMFALPWYLTWFGHSLPRYADVVRLYDFFLCEPPLMPVYVTAAVVLHRADEVLECECDMAMLHCLLSRLPDALPWEALLAAARRLHRLHPPHALEPAVLELERAEEEARVAEDLARRQRAEARARGRGAGRAGGAVLWRCWRGAGGRWPAARRLALAAAAALLGVYLYYRPELLPS